MQPNNSPESLAAIKCLGFTGKYLVTMPHLVLVLCLSHLIFAQTLATKEITFPLLVIFLMVIGLSHYYENIYEGNYSTGSVVIILLKVS